MKDPENVRVEPEPLFVLISWQEMQTFVLVAETLKNALLDASHQEVWYADT